MQSMQGMQKIEAPLLTARQVQRMLGVDRSTVYRMAEDGRLPALKIGRQWRFHTGQIEQLLGTDNPAGNPAGNPVVTDPAAPVDAAGVGASSVINVAADLLGVMMVVTDMEGRPLTPVANPCPWFAGRADDPDTIAACVAEWRLLADDLDFEPKFFTGLLGFECARTYIRSGRTLVGMVLAGGVAPPGSDSTSLYRLDDAQRRRVLAALPKVAATLSRSIADPGSSATHSPTTTATTITTITRRTP